MFNRRLFSIILLFAFCDSLSAQQYITPQYGTRIVNNVIYGVDKNACGKTDTLRMDIWYPVGDNNPLRPVMLWVHGGAFAGGDRSEMTQYCQAMASRGYISATVSYRLGIFNNGGQNPYCQDTKCAYSADTIEPIRAIYRAQQDVKGAIRWIKKNADSVCADNFFAGGSSAGSIAMLAAVYMKTKPAQCDSVANASAAVVYAGCRLNPSGCSFIRGDLGPLNGTLNLYQGIDARVRGVVDMMGAMLDTGAIDAGDPPILLYHKPTDLVVSNETGRPFFGVAYSCGAALGILCGDPNIYWGWPSLHGSSQIYKHIQNDLGGSIAADTLLRNNCTVNCTATWCHDVYWNEVEEKIYTFLKSKHSTVCNNTGIAAGNTVAEIMIFPSYVTDNQSDLHITFSGGGPDNCMITIYDQNGRAVRKMELKGMPDVSGFQAKINIGSLPNGIYYLRMQQGNKRGGAKFLVDK